MSMSNYEKAVSVDSNEDLSRYNFKVDTEQVELLFVNEVMDTPSLSFTRVLEFELGEEMTKKITYLKEKTPEQKMFKEVTELLKLDGWVEVDQDFAGKVALIFTVHGDIVHRYVEWDSEYSEWHQSSFYFPAFYTSDRASLDDIDDYSVAIMGALTIPKLTEKTKEALQIMNDFYQAEEMEMKNERTKDE